MTSPIEDESMELKLAVATIYPNKMQGIIPIGATNSPYESLGVGAPQVLEIETTTELAGLHMDTLDEAYFLADCIGELSDFNFNYNMAVQICFSSTKVGGATGIDFKFYAKGVADGIALTDAKVSPDATIVFPAMATNDTAKIHKTARLGFGPPGTFLDDEFIQCCVELTDRGDAAALGVRVHALRLFGVRTINSTTGKREFL